MIQKTIFFIIFTLFFTACAERGYLATPIKIKPQTTPYISVKKVSKKTTLSSKQNPIKKIKTIEHVQKKEAPVSKNIASKAKEVTNNKISAFFILLIGIIILL